MEQFFIGKFLNRVCLYRGKKRNEALPEALLEVTTELPFPEIQLSEIRQFW